MAEAAFPGREGRIAYSREVNHNALNWEIITANRDSTGYQSMTFNSEIDSNPAWSPDGSQIAFDSDVSGDREIYTVEDSPAFRSSIRRTTSPGYDGEPAWSPGGTKIAFRRGEGAAAEIWVMNVDGTGQAQITSNLSFDGAPAWSPDGTEIAFQSDRDDPLAHELYTMDSDGTNVARLTTSSGEDANPNWHPDGSRLVFDSDRGGNPELYAMDASPGAAATQLTNHVPPYDATRPAWSPDGTKIVYVSNANIYVANADGSGETGISYYSFVPPNDAPDWQPLLGPEPPVPYDHPGAANTMHVPLVPEFRQTISNTQCQARGGTPSSHGAPLSFDSCHPAGFLPGTFAHLGPLGSSYADLTAIPGDPATAPNEARLRATLVMTDIRSPTGDDYFPSHPYVRMRWRWRLSDAMSAPRHLQPGTTTDFEQQVNVQCVATADPTVGSTCNGTTDLQIWEDKASIIQSFRVRMLDVGQNGLLADADDKQFASQGIYIP